MGKRLRLIRIYYGLTQVKLASLCGISQPVLSQIERNQLIPNEADLNRIITAIKYNKLAVT